MVWNGIEKRRFVRANLPCKIIVYTPTEHIIITHTENIGAGGVRVILDECLNISSIVGLEIFLDDEPIKCESRIVWVIEKETSNIAKDRRWDTGVEFYKIDEEDRNIVNNFVEGVVANEK
jgi:c-di-GMP-binding flagellar brake protein YcgR